LKSTTLFHSSVQTVPADWSFRQHHPPPSCPPLIPSILTLHQHRAELFCLIPVETLLCWHLKPWCKVKVCIDYIRITYVEFQPELRLVSGNPYRIYDGRAALLFMHCIHCTHCTRLRSDAAESVTANCTVNCIMKIFPRWRIITYRHGIRISPENKLARIFQIDIMCYTIRVRGKIALKLHSDQSSVEY